MVRRSIPTMIGSRSDLLLLLVWGIVIGSCVAAICTAQKREPIVLEFVSTRGTMAGRLVRYECTADGVEDCLRAAGNDLCGKDQFEIVESAPLRYGSDGEPHLSYRCFTTRAEVL
jgi:hypothetical protein